MQTERQELPIKPKAEPLKPAATRSPAPRKKGKMKQNMVGWAFVAPIVLFVVSFIYYGIFYNAYNSFFSWDGISFDKAFVGLSNYAEMFGDPDFYLSLKNTFLATSTNSYVQSVLGASSRTGSAIRISRFIPSSRSTSSSGQGHRWSCTTWRC
ncbi:carbohydrate ABC transporter permease [Exiguobacterium oxidotolerans]|uniref:carbohydrate ABC transporter permease n=1 Tax=Exiguobacterium oxidotolerans TaxID=223958 RepID=UPI000B31E628|nr:hypothetical protein [Exiguobacterium oxidotolerans]